MKGEIRITGFSFLVTVKKSRDSILLNQLFVLSQAVCPQVCAVVRVCNRIVLWSQRYSKYHGQLQKYKGSSKV